MADPDGLSVEIYRRLSRQDAEGALELFEDALAASVDRPALRARLHGWHAQALLQVRRPEEASSAALRGIRAARSIGDSDGVTALRDLQTQAIAQAGALKAPPPDVTTPVGLAVAALDDGRNKAGELLALGAFRQAQAAGDDREAVLAMLALARLPHRTEAALRRAHGLADASGDMNLVTAVAKAFNAAGVEIKAKVF
ncbi:MAG: hypothetical protein P8R54_25475 [Myxococcota bacterium]|nr:hypothetical protein [Myxococcota bacterium]